MKDLNYLLNSPYLGIAHHKIILDEHDNPVDYQFIEVNETFKRLTGLKNVDLTNKTAIEVFPSIEKDSFDWIACYGEIALNCTEKHFEQYSTFLKRWYKIHAYSTQKLFFTTVFTDITEQINNAKLLKRKEQEIISQKEQIEKFFDQSLHGFFICMLDEPIEWNESTDKEKVLEYVLEHQRMTRANQAMLAQYNATEKDFIGITIRELFKHDLDHARKIFRGLFDKGKWQIETYEQKLDGTPMIVEGDYICIYDDKGRIIGHTGVQVEITGRKHTEEKLNNSLMQQQAITESAQDAIIMMNPDGIISFWNPSAERIFGYSEHEAKGKDLHLLLAPERFHEQYQKGFKEFSATGKGAAVNKTIELAGRKKDGSEFPIELSLTSLKQQDGWHSIGIVRDISDRKQAQEELLMQHNLLEAVLDSITDIIAIQNPDHSIVRYNQAGYNMLGKSKDEVEGKKCYELIGKKQECENCATSITLKTKKFEETEKYIPEMDLYLNCRSNPVLDKDGNVMLVIEHLRDITSQKTAEKNLKASEELLNLAMTVKNEGIWDWDIASNNTYFDDRYYTMAGYQPGEFEQSFDAWSKLVHPEDLAKGETAIEDHLSGRSDIFEVVFRFKHKNGNWMWIKSCGKIVKRDENGKPVRFVGIHTDITSQKLAEEALANERQLLSSILEAAPIGMWMVDENQNPILVNKTFEQQTGFGTDKISMTPQEIAKCKQTDDDTIKKGSAQTYEETVTFKDSTKHVLKTIKTPLYNTDNSLKGILGIGVDVTSQKEAELKLITAKKQADEANKAKSRFVANMSHEIRTPLNGVIGFTDLLKSTPLSAVQKQYVDNANVSGRTLLGIINNILDFSKIEAGMMELEITKTDMIKLFENSIDVIKFAANTKQLEVLLNIDISMPRFAMVDSVRLGQILANLLGNAVKFTKQGEVELKVDYTHIDSNHGKYKIAVRDTGIGIHETQKEKIFKAFSQADDSISRNYGGTGLGLVISDMIAQKMGTKIQLESFKDEGTTFFFELTTKIEKASSQNPETVCSKHQALEKNIIQSTKPDLTILIAEDIPMNMLLTKSMLSKIIPEAKIIEAENGKAALQQYKENCPQIVLMDIQMPEMDGITATKAIRDIEASFGQKNNTKIIALTAGVLKEEIEKCYQAGMNDFLPKPIDKKKLNMIIEMYK